MKSREAWPTFLVAICLAWIPCGSVVAQKTAVRTFRSSVGFEVSYPLDWNRISANPARLEIINGNGRSTGTVIGKNTASIVVASLVPTADRSIGEMLRELARGDSILSDTAMSQAHDSVGRCSSLRVVTVRDELLPKRWAHISYIGCEVSGRVVLTTLMFYENEIRSDAWLKTALDIARSSHWRDR